MSQEAETEAEIQIRRNYSKSRPRRCSISAEVIPPPDESFNIADLDAALLEGSADTQLDRNSLKKVLEEHVLFSDLDEDQNRVVSMCFLPREYKSGDTVIRQGEDGHLFYIVEKGQLNVFVQNGLREQKVKEYGDGDAFGELALMYNQPRAATVRVKSTDCTLWAIDRTNFIKILQSMNWGKKKVYERCLKSVPLLKSLNNDQMTKLIDSMIPQTFDVFEEMVKEGEIENSLHILIQGAAVASSSAEPHKKKDYKPGDFYGEMALLTDQPRAATVIATEPCTVYVIDKESFTRLLGPCKEILQARMEEIKSSTI